MVGEPVEHGTEHRIVERVDVVEYQHDSIVGRAECDLVGEPVQ